MAEKFPNVRKYMDIPIKKKFKWNSLKETSTETHYNQTVKRQEHRDNLENSRRKRLMITNDSQ